MAFGLKGIGTNQLRQLLRAAIGMTLHCEKDERMHHIFHTVFVNNKLFLGYVNGSSYVQKILESCGSNKYALTQAMSQPGLFWTAVLVHALILLEYCMQERLVPTLLN